MTLNIKNLRQQAESRLKASAYDPKKLVLIHTAIALGASLAVTLIGFLINLEIANTGGLSGMGTRSILTTVQMMLELAVMVLLPFWNIGLIRAALNWSTGERAEIPTLLEGFRRFGPVLRQNFLMGGLFMIVAFLASQIASTVYMLTPFSKPLMELMSQIMEANDPYALMDEAFTAQMLEAMTPVLVIFGIFFAGLAIPLFYRVRFSEFSLMDGARALKSMLISFRITKGSVKQIVKLDLSFWWFYALQGLTVALSYGDAILAAAGITLPMSGDASFFLFYVLGAAAQLALLWQFQAKVSATYAEAYQTLNSEKIDN